MFRETAAQLAGLVGLMRVESATDNLGGLAMLNALSTALFAIVPDRFTPAGSVKVRLQPAALTTSERPR